VARLGAVVVRVVSVAMRMVVIVMMLAVGLGVHRPIPFSMDGA
jgi:hypothetical protein